MKKLFITFLFYLLFFSTQAMIINDVVVTPLNNQDINIHLNVTDGSVFNFANSSYAINTNTITLTCCYNTLYFLAVTTLENDIILPNINLNTTNYNLIVTVNFQNFPSNTCEYSILSDTETLNFSTPLTSAVSLGNATFENSKKKHQFVPKSRNEYL